MWRVLALAPHEVPSSFVISLFQLFSFTALCVRCSLYQRVRYKVTPNLDKLDRHCASDADHSCEHSVHDVICCWARSAVRVHSISEKVSAWKAQQMSSAQITLRLHVTGRSLVYNLNNVGARSDLGGIRSPAFTRS